MDRTPYIYKLTDNVTGMWYIGASYCKGAHPCKLGVKYHSSSKVVKKIYKEQPERFTSQILLIGSLEYVVQTEASYLSKLDAKHDPMSYNGHNGDGKMNCSKFGSQGGLITGKINGLRAVVEKTGIFSDEFDRSANGTLAAKRTVELGVGLYGRSKEKIKEDATKAGKRTYELGLGVHAEPREVKSARGKIIAAENMRLGKAIFAEGMKSKAGKIGIAVTNSQRWRCGECEMTTNSGSLASHQRRTGHNGKVRISG